MVVNIEKKTINHDILMRDYVSNVERMSKDGGSRGMEMKLIEKIMMEKVNEEFCGGKHGRGELDGFWRNRVEKAMARGDDCPICLGGVGDGKPLYVLSCSHMFHAPCLTSFEMYRGGDGGGSGGGGHACPVCRQNYEKKPLMGLPGRQQVVEVHEGLDED